jgi:hypothetical protein
VYTNSTDRTLAFQVKSRGTASGGDSVQVTVPLMSTNNSNTVGSLFTTGGNVGIGNASPNAKLDVSGDISFPYGSSMRVGAGTNWPSGTTRLIQVDWNSNGMSGDTVSFYTPGSQTATPRINIASNGVINLNGNVGIGTTSPRDRLQIEQSTGAAIRIRSTTRDNYSEIAFDHSLSDYWHINGYSNDTSSGKRGAAYAAALIRSGSGSDNNNYEHGDLQFWTCFDSQPDGTGGTGILYERMRIRSNGSVGIGTVSPGATLNVYGSSWFDNGSGDSATRALGTTVSTAPGADYTVGGDPGDSLRTLSIITKGATRPTILCFRNIDAGNTGFWDMIADPKTSGFYLQNSNGTIPFMAKTNGRIGLGTTDPQQRLHVSGGRIRIDDSNNGVLELKTNSYISYLFTESDGNVKLYPASTSNHVLLQPSGGFVGVGTTSPQAPFHVGSAATFSSSPTGSGVFMGMDGGNYAQIQLNGASGSYIDFSTSGTDFKGRILYDNTNNFLSFNTNGAERVRINSSGYLGIGTSSPNYPLAVLSNVYSEFDPYFFINGAGVIDPGYQGGYFSAYFNNAIQASQLWSTSDARVKTNVLDISDPSSLSILRQLQPRTFSFIDSKKSNGNLRVDYGFIAQEVEAVLPDAVTLSVGCIPSILETCDAVKQIDENDQCTGTEITLATKTIPETWTQGTILRLFKSDGDNQEVTVRSLDTVTNKFVVEETLDDSRYFVYGEKVNDFRVLHKDVIFAITTAAVQEIDRQLQDERQKTAALETEVATLQQQYQDLLDRITNLESK